LGGLRPSPCLATSLVDGGLVDGITCVERMRIMMWREGCVDGGRCRAVLTGGGRDPRAFVRTIALQVW